MKKTLDIQQFEGDQSIFTIDFIKDINGRLSVDIIQKSENTTWNLSGISIDELTSLISSLQHCYALMQIVELAAMIMEIEDMSKGIIKLGILVKYPISIPEYSRRYQELIFCEVCILLFWHLHLICWAWWRFLFHSDSFWWVTPIWFHWK